MTAVAYVVNATGGRVELFYQGIPLTIALRDDGTGGDSEAGDNFYTFQYTFQPGELTVPLEIDLRMRLLSSGQTSLEWPLLTVNP